MHLLLANTRLESTLPVNLVLLGRDGRPRSKHLKQIVDEWIAFRFETITRRTRHRLGEVDRRIHILEGRLLALLSIDKVICIIRKADDPKADLIAEFGLTDVQAEDILEILETRTVSPVVMLDTQGRAYTVRASEIPGGRGDGVPVTTLIELQPGAKIVAALCAAPEQKYLVAGSGGYGFVATFDDMVSKQRAGRAFMTLDANEEPIAPVALAEGLDHVAALSSRGRLLVFPLAEMREVPRGRGVIVMGLDGEETLVTVGLATARKVIMHGTNRLGRAVELVIEGDEFAKYLLRRASKGRAVSAKIKVTGFGREG